MLDYLDLERSSNHIKIQTQVEEVADIKRNALYQNNIFPFLGVDARQTGFDLLEGWAKKYINVDKGFCRYKNLSRQQVFFRLIKGLMHCGPGQKKMKFL